MMKKYLFSFYKILFLAVLMFDIGQLSGQTTIESQSFRTGSNPTGWTASNIAFSTSAGGFANFTAGTGVLTSPVYNLSSFSTISMSFNVAKFGTGNDGPLTVQVSNDNGITWTAQNFNSTTPTSSTYQENNVDITVRGPEVRIRFLSSSSASNKRFRDYNLTGTLPSGKTVTFNSNGGAGTMPNQTASTATALSSNTFTRSGFTFSNWHTTASGSGGTSYSDNALFPFTTDATMYAQWVSNYSLTFANLQFPGTATIDQGHSFTAYGQVYAMGLTEAPGAGADIQAEFGISSSNTDPVGWTNWVAGTFNAQEGNNDSYAADLGANLPPGTYYYATRFRIGSGSWVYGGYRNNSPSPTNGGIWNGTSNINGTLTVNSNLVDYANFQFPHTGTVSLGNSYVVNGQTYEPGVTTPAGGAGAGITAEVAFSAVDTHPNTWSAGSWNNAIFNVQAGNNYEYQYNIGSKFTAAGNYFMAFRYLR